MKVLFVCSGNICRSPMAEAYFAHRVATLDVESVQASSAGTLGIEGSPASPEAVEVMREIGVELTAHRSSGVSASVVARADVLIAMDRGHLEVLAERFPVTDAAARPRLLLRAFEGGDRPSANPPDLKDPMTLTVSFYREQRATIVRCVDHLVEFVRSSR